MPCFGFTYIIDNGYSKQKYYVPQWITDDTNLCLIMAQYAVIIYSDFDEYYKISEGNTISNFSSAIEVVQEFHKYENCEKKDNEKYYQIKNALSTIKITMNPHLIPKKKIVSKPLSINLSVLNYTL